MPPPALAPYPPNQLQFPASENQGRPGPQPQPQPPPAMPKHTRTSSFFSAFRPNKQSSKDSKHQRAASMDSSNSAAQTSGGGSTPRAGSMVNQGEQTQHHERPNQVPQAPLPTSPTMLQQQQSAAADYQQPLPPTPPETWQTPTGPVNNASHPPPTSQSPSLGGASPQQVPAVQPPALHPEIRSVVGLTVAHAHKIYFSGPLVRRIERQADGQRPHKDDGWTEVWAQLGGTTLSLWDMKEVQEASRQGKEVPPTYVNVTDAFIQVLGSVTVPATPTSGPKRYTNVLTLNTAGSNLLLFSCPSTPALISWASALRLSAWEKSRLEEIYTAHLIRITLSNRDYATTLVRGKLEGWAQIRVAGQTDWKRMWICITEGSGLSQTDSNNGVPPTSQSLSGKKKRMSSLFGRDNSPPRFNLPTKASITMYAGQKPKERRKPLLTMTDVSQAFSVYPERPELIPRSSLIKVEGTFGDEEMAISMKAREGWILIMPLMEHIGPNGNQSAEMLKWVVALHDAFGLYGRPQSWTWDPRDPTSLMFGYPVGPQKEHLFLDREVVENMDPRDDRTSIIRLRLREMLIDFIKSPNGQPRNGQEAAANGGPPSLPPIPGVESGNMSRDQSPNGASQPFLPQRFQGQSNGTISGPQLPPLSFGERPPEISRPLTPITERDSINTHNNAGGANDNQRQSPTSPSFSPLVSPQIHKQHSQGKPQESSTLAPLQNDLKPVLGREISHSPLAISPAPSPRNVSPPQPLTGTTLNSFEDKGPQHSRTSAESSRTDGSTPAPLSPNRREGSVNTSPRSPTLPPKDSLAENEAKPSNDDALAVNQRQSVRPALQQPEPAVLPQPATLIKASTSAGERNDDFVNEAGALYFMQQAESKPSPETPTKQPVQFDNDGDSDSASEDDFPKASQKQPAKPVSSIGSDSTSLKSDSSFRHPPVRQSTPMAFVDENKPTKISGVPNSGPIPAASSSSLIPSVPNTDSEPRLPVDRGYASGRSALGRKPSGARAPQPVTKGIGGQVAGYPTSFHSQQLASQHEESEEEEEEEAATSSRRKYISPQQEQYVPIQANKAQQNPLMAPSVANAPQQQVFDTSAGEDDNTEALAALAYLDVSEPSKPSAPASATLTSTDSPQIVTVKPLNTEQAGIQSESASGSHVKSSFAPSRQAEERKKKAQAQQAALQAAVNKPGRANGKRLKGVGNSWNESSDEEEDEEEDEDEEVDSDGEPSQAPPPPRMQQQANAALQAQQQFAPQSSIYPSVGGDPAYHLRPPRTLPQPPMGSRLTSSDEYIGQGPRRQASDQLTENGRRAYLDDGLHPRPKPEGPAPGAARQTVWSQVLEAGRPGANFHSPNEPTQSNGRDTFVQLEPSETMTKAFTPQGLLSAGMQDKQDRSAKRQEELARETGASLINVPNKPPPPQTGLLGAITAHERERKREGGVGAALTEREREKRVAEERQRRFDEQQRQQLDQMQQGGSMYGAPFGYNPMMNPMMMGMNPMMGMSPMMTGGGMMGGQPGLSPMMTGGGMNPMMTGGGMNPMMGYGMMPGFNPQHLFAAQQAAQAYQNAMLAFSVAGSQVGGDGGNGMQGMNPQQGMMGQGNLGVYDPRMSMNLMGMGMMGGMGGMIPSAPLNPQTTGISQFDPRLGIPGNINGSPATGESGLGQSSSPLHLGNSQNLGTPNSQFASGTNSPIGRGSSPLRHSETPQRSRPTSPKV